MLDKLEKKNFTLDRLREMDSKEIGHLIHHVRAGGDVKKAAMEIPVVELEATIQVGNKICVMLSSKQYFHLMFLWSDVRFTQPSNRNI